ncbi:MAG: hypothetical protein AB7O43_04140 [Hyphomicrobiaceae bacterium]
MTPTDLLDVARDLLKSSTRPKQAKLRRACSTTYYALFHTLCSTCANTMIKNKTTRRAWVQAYRCINHGTAKHKCLKKTMMNQFPNDIQDFANMFVQMQEKRHRADYDPTGLYYKSAVEADIEAVETVIDAFLKCDKRHQRAFVIYVAVEGPRA